MKKRLSSTTNLEFGSQDAPNFARPARRHEKLPPPITVPASASTPDLHSKPNYMKATISADVRREQANMRRNNNLDVTNSSNNLTKELAGIRTLMKRDASFRPERTLVRKDHPDVLRRSLQVERVTCSSALKGFKSPERISNGGTESEGTSGVKVCSYSRCSLNAHVHALLPPLNSFVSARRQELKTERSIKQRCQSPMARPIRDNRNSAKLIVQDDGATSNGGEMCYGIDSPENLVENGNLNSMERVDAAYVHEKYNEVIVAGDKSPQYSAQEVENEILGRYCRGSMPNVNLHEVDPQSSDLDREKGKQYPTYLDDYECAPNMEEESGEQGGKFITSDEFMMKPDDRSDRFFDEISADEVSQESYDEESLNSDTLFTGDNCDSTGSYNYLESLCSKKPSSLILVPVPEAAPVCQNNALFGGSQTPITCSQNSETTMGCNSTDGEEHNLKDESLPNEDPTIEMANQEPQPLEGSAEEMATLVDCAMYQDIKHDQVLNQASSDETNSLSDTYHIKNIEKLQEHVCNFNGDIKHDQVLNQASSDETNSLSDTYHIKNIEKLQEHVCNFNGGNQTRGIHPQNGYATMCLSTMDGEENNREDESLPNEDPTTERENQAPQLSEGPAEETATFVDRAPCEAIKHDQDHAENEQNPAENFNGESARNLINEPYPEFSGKNSSGAECEVVREVNSRNMETPETEDKSSIQATTNCKKSNQEAAGPACFNPHEPHLLPPQSDPEAEKVHLRHQELEARKNAEEWMVDYALREAVTKIGPARQRKVATLVEAYERVLPTSKS